MSALAEREIRDATEPPEFRLGATTPRSSSRHAPTALRAPHLRDLPTILGPGDLLVVNTRQRCPRPFRPSWRGGCRCISTQSRARPGARVANQEAARGRRRSTRLELPTSRSTSAPYAGERRLAVGRLELEHRSSSTSTGTATRSATATSVRSSSRRVPDGLRPAPRQRRDAERGQAVHSRAGDGASRARRPLRPDHVAHGRLLGRCRRAALPGALRGSRRPPPVNGWRWWRGRDRGRHDSGPRPRETTAAPDGTKLAGAGWTSLTVTPSAGSTRSMASRATRASLAPPTPRGRRGPDLLERLIARRTRRATAGTSRRLSSSSLETDRAHAVLGVPWSPTDVAVLDADGIRGVARPEVHE
jgi:hypothetical protein